MSHRPSSVPARALGAAALGAVLVLAGCGGSAEDPADSAADTAADTASSASPSPDASTEPSPSDDDGSSEPAEEGTVVEVSFQDGQVTPNGERVEAAVGEPVTLRVDADAAGEIHVHSTPENTFDFEPGQSEFTFTVDSPGIVEVELHDPTLVIVQLEVR